MNFSTFYVGNLKSDNWWDEQKSHLCLSVSGLADFSLSIK